MKVIDLGLIQYIKGYNFQKKKVEEVASGISKNLLVLAEHPSTITIGRTGSRKNILSPEEELRRFGILVYEIDRGGDVTYHCPGQLLLYPIIHLEERSVQIHRYLRFLEQVCIEFLKRFGVFACQIKNQTGVWIKDKKIASIGIGIKRWVTYHGMAININNNIEGFSLINPCGMKGLKITSLKEELGFEIDLERAKDILIKVFTEVYGTCFTKEAVPALA